ncbi:MAG TPA: squalene synthase HpnC [Candidatus Kapabacteria bacterium]
MKNPSLSEAYDHCRKIALGHYENFPVGSMLLPRTVRKHFFALYAFMRSADDFADLPHRPQEERLELLGEWRSQLHSIFCKEAPTNLIFLALQDTVRKFDLSIGPFERLLDAFEFDARGNVRFETFDDLHWYTERSAEPVGELVLALFGYRDAAKIGTSNNICTALQLINFLQDAKEDLANNRCYFPMEDCRLFGIGSIKEIPVSPSRNGLIQYECDRIQKLLDAGSPLPESVSSRFKLELRAVISGGRLMLAKIRSMKGNIFEERPKLSRFEQWHILASAFQGNPVRTGNVLQT